MQMRSRADRAIASDRARERALHYFARTRFAQDADRPNVALPGCLGHRAEKTFSGSAFAKCGAEVH